MRAGLRALEALRTSAWDVPCKQGKKMHSSIHRRFLQNQVVMAQAVHCKQLASCARAARGSFARRASGRAVAVTSTAQLKLFDAPQSNHGARVRIVARWKGLLNDGTLTIASPSDVGGIKSEEYLKLNPQGKMPLLYDTETGEAIPESDVIVQYLISRFADRG